MHSLIHIRDKKDDSLRIFVAFFFKHFYHHIKISGNYNRENKDLDHVHQKGSSERSKSLESKIGLTPLEMEITTTKPVATGNPPLCD